MANNQLSFKGEGGEYKIWWDEKNCIGRIFVSGEIQIEESLKITKESIKIAEQYGKKKGWLINAVKVTKPIFSLRLRKIMAEAKKVMSFGKVAVVCTSTVLRVTMSFVLVAVRKKNVKFFKTEEEALKWLKEE